MEEQSLIIQGLFAILIHSREKPNPVQLYSVLRLDSTFMRTVEF